ncbi:hypothetical protein BDW74DRAFT_185288 [Aspergillus multicolor]|uniref:uncharacterized protein n=1 Tax=Aspergillus multicolor TaxID=41759 RepID=UPI003CCCC677
MSHCMNSQEPRLLPALLDHRAARQPDQVWAKFPVSPTSYTQGFRAATYAQMRNAVDYMAYFLAESIGTSEIFTTLAYMGPGDLRYYIVLLAAVKTGYKPFFPSPRNSISAQKDLLTRLETRALVTTDPELPFVTNLLRHHSIQVIQIPSLDELLCLKSMPSYQYDRTYDAARNEPVFVLHTSGPTGTPKPLVYTHEFVWRLYVAATAPPPDLEGLGDARIEQHFLQGEWLCFLPSFHIAGIGYALVAAMYNSNIPVFPLPTRPPSAEYLVQAVQHGKFTWAFLLPVMADELSHDPAALTLVAKHLQYLFYTGGALPNATGKTVSSAIPLYSALGSSECGVMPQLRLPPAPAGSPQASSEPWQYLHLHPCINAQFQPYLDDLHELVIVKSTSHPETQPVFSLFPDSIEYATRDLFSAHPTIPHLWRHRGRRDDIVVFLNGEKTNPVTFEAQISQHPGVNAALVAGDQRVEACLLIEPAGGGTGTECETAKERLVQAVWRTVEEANAECPAHARVSRSMILVADPARPFLRAGKGNVQRAGTLRLYREEIDALYLEEGLEAAQATPAGDNPARLLTNMRHARSTEVEDSADFFALGLDSLQALRMSAAIRAAAGVSISPVGIYRSPTLNLLADAVYSNSAEQVEDEDNRLTTMAQLLDHYRQQIDRIETPTEPVHNSSKDSQPSAEQAIILTGSTGTIGSFLLDHLLAQAELESSHVDTHIYCLNRATDSAAVQAARNKTRKLRHAFPSGKVTFLTADLTHKTLGLSEATYQTLRATATQIIHAAWPVDFNQPLPAFTPSLTGVLNLIAFARAAPRAPSLLFLSSVAAVTRYHATTSITTLPTPASTGGSDSSVPETIIADPACAAPMGYGESKNVAERMVAYAGAALRIPCGIVRIGQVCGAAGAMDTGTETATARAADADARPRGWNAAEWLPSLVVSSRHLRALPDNLGMGVGVRTARAQRSLSEGGIDWVPVDLLAPILAELSALLSDSECTAHGQGKDEAEAGAARVFHCVNPDHRGVAWEDLLPAIREELVKPCRFGGGIDGVDVVPMAEWVGRLRDSVAAAVDVDLAANPAARLLGFFEQTAGLAEAGGPGVVRLSTVRTARVSRRSRQLRAIRPEWMRGWVREWLD